MGNLILRMGIGLLFIMHGYPKVMAGPERWEALGNTMQGFGIKFAPILWGAAASFSEFIGGVLLVIGLLVRPSAFFLFVTMGVAVHMHLSSGQGFDIASHAMALGVASLSLIFSGAGKYGLDRIIFKGSKED